MAAFASLPDTLAFPWWIRIFHTYIFPCCSIGPSLAAPSEEPHPPFESSLKFSFDCAGFLHPTPLPLGTLCPACLFIQKFLYGNLYKDTHHMVSWLCMNIMNILFHIYEYNECNSIPFLLSTVSSMSKRLCLIHLSVCPKSQHLVHSQPSTNMCSLPLLQSVGRFLYGKKSDAEEWSKSSKCIVHWSENNRQSLEDWMKEKNHKRQGPSRSITYPVMSSWPAHA